MGLRPRPTACVSHEPNCGRERDEVAMTESRQFAGRLFPRRACFVISCRRKCIESDASKPPSGTESAGIVGKRTRLFRLIWTTRRVSPWAGHSIPVSGTSSINLRFKSSPPTASDPQIPIDRTSAPAPFPERGFLLGRLSNAGLTVPRPTPRQRPTSETIHQSGRSESRKRVDTYRPR
jgi:hypothetical protein